MNYLARICVCYDYTVLTFQMLLKCCKSHKLFFFKFKIYFPTGTHVHLRLWKFQTEMVIEVDIFPSVFDENVSKGLCSKLGSNTLIGSDNTDFHHSQRPDAFSKSWM